MNIEKALDIYSEKFEDNFPVFAVNHLDEAEIVALIVKAIEQDQPFEAKYEDEGAY